MPPVNRAEMGGLRPSGGSHNGKNTFKGNDSMFNSPPPKQNLRIEIKEGSPIGAQACSPPKPFPSPVGINLTGPIPHFSLDVTGVRSLASPVCCIISPITAKM